MFITRLMMVVRSACPIEELKKHGLDEVDKKPEKNKDKKNKVQKENEDMQGRYRNFILNILRNKEVLMILDNAEDPLEDDNEKFINELETLIDHCPNLKFLVTTRTTINKLAHNHEKPYPLNSLTKEASIKLLITKAPRDIKNKEIHELLECPIPEECKFEQTLDFSSPAGASNANKKNLLNHPFTVLLGGHPQAISLAAPLLEYKSLKELFLAFCNSNMMDALSISPSSPNKNTSLRVSLELSITHMKNSCKEALHLFNFMGLLPGGIGEKELSQMWGGRQWQGHKDALVRASLLVYKTDAKGGFMYSLLPFMTIRACEMLEKEGRKFYEYHVRFYMSDRTMDMIEELVGAETNIWACICRKRPDISEFKESLQEEAKISQTEGANITQELNTTESEIGWDISKSVDQKGNGLKMDKKGANRSIGPKTGISQPIAKKTISDVSVEPNRAEIRNLSKKGYEDNLFFEEEMLAIFYIAILVMLHKDSDAFKAITEYRKKKDISKI